MSGNWPFNILIVGIGGQGVATLAQVLRTLCERQDFPCNGAIIKGGAQRLGRITASLRIFPRDKPDYGNYSTEIPAGGLDLLIGLEPWEALKSAQLCRPQTKLIVNSEPVPLMISRTRDIKISDPIEAMKRLGLVPLAKPYGSRAAPDFGSKKMLNFVIGADAIRQGIAFFDIADYVDCFQEATGKKLS